MTSTGAHYLTGDRQGSIAGIANSSGAVTANYAYDAYGVPSTWGVVGSAPRFRYTGQAVIPEAKLYYYKARVYDPTAGKFLQTDPVGDANDLNLYLYVSNDPVNAEDPTGLVAEPCTGSRLAGGCASSASPVASFGTVQAGTTQNGAGALPPAGVQSRGRFQIAAGGPGIEEESRPERRPGEESEGREIAEDAYSGMYQFYSTRLRFLDPNNKALAPSVGPPTYQNVQDIENSYERALGDTAEKIAQGHAFAKHAGEFGAASRAEFGDIAYQTLRTSVPRQLQGGRSAYYDVGRNTLVIVNPQAESTMFKPRDGLAYFLFGLR